MYHISPFFLLSIYFHRKLCLFADRDIESDEEITIDYSPKHEIPIDRLNSSYSLVIECACGTARCRGNIY